MFKSISKSGSQIIKNKTGIVNMIDTRGIINGVNKIRSQDSDIQNIIEADKFMAITMDDMSFKLSQLTDLFIKNQKTLDSLLEYTVKNGERLKVIEEQALAGADEAGVLRRRGIVTPFKFVIIDTMEAPNHMVKSYTVKNDGPNIIFVAHNAAISSQLDVDITDVTSPSSNFEQILPNEDIRFSFNRNKIRNIHILAKGGNSNFRSWLAW